MKRIAVILFPMILFQLAACYKIPRQKGFLSPDLKLKGSDTLTIPLGGKGATDVAWLDGSSIPCRFSIENVRDEEGNRSGQFFEEYPYLTWIKPYDHFTDTTEDLVMAKLQEQQLPPFSINPVNGSLEYFETTRGLQSPGDVFHVDVKVANSTGERVYKDYAILKLGAKSRPYDFYRSTVAIILVNGSGQTLFTLYDYIPETDLERRENVYEHNGKELIDIYKKSDEPATGIKVLIQYLDAEGKIFPSKDYATYATGTESYFDYAVNRTNTDEGAMIEFPVTPWPVNQDLLSYLKGGTMGYDVLDTATLHKELYVDKKYDTLDSWPAPDWGASKWFIRLRSRIVFHESGTWVISCKFPYTHLDKTF